MLTLHLISGKIFEVEFEEGMTIRKLILILKEKGPCYVLDRENRRCGEDKLVQDGERYYIFTEDYLKAWEEADNLDLEEYDPEIDVDGDQEWD